MRWTFTVSMDNGTSYDIDADARDIRAWEAEHDASWFATRLSFTTIAQLAHIAGRRTGVLNGAYPDYPAFDAACVDARFRKDEPLVADPTPPDPGGGSSAPSRSGFAASRPRSNRRTRT